MNIYFILSTVLFVLNIILASLVVFLERKDASSTWAWLMVLLFVPFLGFALYIIFGRKLRRKHLFEWEDEKKIGTETLLKEQIESMREHAFRFQEPATSKYRELIFMHLGNNGAVLTQENSVQLLTDGKDKFDALLNDIRNAKDHIHLEYYIFRKDNLGRKLISALTEKAREGVKVRILYDDLGSRRLSRRSFRELIKAGGEVEAFFPSKLPYVNLRLNYRNHRKINVIDGKIGYVGGFNVGDEYLGKNERFGYWRDTHLRMEGTAVHAMQTRFILDWNQASHRHDINYADCYFPEVPPAGNVAAQIVTSGPESEWEQIKNGYIKMITSAKYSIYIQTPYFIPDASVLDALRIAALSGVDVRVMIPDKPDHIFVYWATYSYIGELLKAGVKVYIYENGFLHAKTIVVDEEICSVGTANIDVRSFRLNFEVNAFLYHRETSAKLALVFRDDMEKSLEITMPQYKQRTLMIRFKESVSRLLSPIL
ncbi:cardiolipin synthase [Bacillus marinisedimentorum]|uniref:cardiolipin synthase n=1 Tax=Bacillus marinisedimentorum TaxID=1821260 RepID=UPI000873210C|nr:cardiolipin synthase [Bacillus marinisedimentorum]